MLAKVVVFESVIVALVEVGVFVLALVVGVTVERVLVVGSGDEVG